MRSNNNLEIIVYSPEPPGVLHEYLGKTHDLDLQLKRSFMVSPARLRQMHRRAEETLKRRVPRLDEFWRLRLGELPADYADKAWAASIAAALNATGRARASLASVPVSKDLGLVSNYTDLTDLTHQQGYLDAVGARYSWNLWGGDGCGIKVCDCEYGFDSDHRDLPEIAVISSAGGDLATRRDHGTATLGVLAAVDNGWGVTGICKGADILFASESGGHRTQCIGDALLALCPGDVLLLEMQGETPRLILEVPAEFDSDVHAACLVAAGLGITVVAAAGNRSLDLGTVEHPECGRLWDASSRDFRDSLAIIVGGGLPASNRWRCDSNFGLRVTCQAWGEEVCTTVGGSYGSSHQELTCGFHSTSSAAAIVAGVVACLQGRAKAKWGRALSPQLVRSLLSNPANGAGQPLDDWDEHPMGPLPNLEKLFDNIGLQ